MARLVGRQALGRMAGKLTRDDAKQLERFTREAERYVAVLGDMKGVAMKIGQLLSFLDTASIPERHRAAYQQIAGALQADAPPMPIETVHGMVERELGRPVDEVFEWFGTQPMAAASIGQVHAAHLPGGRQVVVKVQYPGVADAIAADLANGELLASIITMGMRLSPVRVRSDPRALVEEIQERIGEELDYRIEATNQQRFADAYRGHPFIRIPEVVHELSGQRVLVMDEADGLRWTAALQEPQDLKDTWGEVINRFVYGSLYGMGAFNADPHPGNYLFHDDGGVTFLDFGCVKHFTPEHLDAMHRVSAAVFEDEDPEALRQAYVDLHLLDPGSKLTAQRLFDWVRPVYGAVVDPQPFTFTPEFAAFVIERNFDPFAEYGDVVRGLSVGQGSKDWTFLMRIQLGLYSVLGSLRATGHWRAVQDELLHGTAPATELGRRHAAWAATRGS